MGHGNGVNDYKQSKNIWISSFQLLHIKLFTWLLKTLQKCQLKWH